VTIHEKIADVVGPFVSKTLSTRQVQAQTAVAKRLLKPSAIPPILTVSWRAILPLAQSLPGLIGIRNI
jgi:hypothetical protein